MALDFSKNITNNFSEIIPDHPHRRMRVLLSILAFCIVVASVTYYQMNKVKEVAVAPPVEVDPYLLTVEQRAKIVADLKEAEEKAPKLSDSERKKILADLKTAEKNTQKMTEEERKRILLELKVVELKTPH